MAEVALGDIDLDFAWQAWHLVKSTLALVARLGLAGAAGLCMAGVALGDMDLHFAWQAWHLWHWAGSGGFCHILVQLFHTHTQLCRTFLSHTKLSRTTLSHTPLSHITFYTQLCHIQFVHTQYFYIHKLTHTTLSHTALSPNLSCTISFLFLAFPISFSHLLSDSWKKLTCGVIRSFNSKVFTHCWVLQ